jgi:hypothetical protein
MNLYGRPLTDPIDPAADRVPILDDSATGDDNRMRDVTVAQLLGAASRIKDIEGIEPTAQDVPDGTWGVCRASDGAVMLTVNIGGGEVRVLKLFQP